MKVIDVVDATTTFIRAAMEKSKPPCLSTIDEERKQISRTVKLNTEKP
jgi:hypothetical protein